MEETTKKGGLLQRAKSLLAEATPKFDIWATKFGFRHAGVFAPMISEKLSDEYYYLSESFGFNAKTVASSVTEKDFWNGKISKTFEWQCFSKDFNETNQFLELFDKEINDEINSLYFLPFNDKKNPMYFVVAEFDDDDPVNLPNAAETALDLRNIVAYQNDENKVLSKIESSIDEGLAISPAYLYIMSLKNCVEKIAQIPAIEGKLSKFDMLDRIEMKTNIINSVTNAAYSVIEPLFQSPNCAHLGTNGEIKIALFAKDEPDEQIISFHTAKTLTELVGEDATKQVLLLSAGICPNKKGAVSFLQKG